MCLLVISLLAFISPSSLPTGFQLYTLTSLLSFNIHLLLLCWSCNLGVKFSPDTPCYYGSELWANLPEQGTWNLGFSRKGN